MYIKAAKKRINPKNLLPTLYMINPVVVKVMKTIKLEVISIGLAKDIRCLNIFFIPNLITCSFAIIL